MSIPLTPKGCKIYYRKETAFCAGGTGPFLAFDLSDQLTEDFEIGVPEKIMAMKNAIGKGKIPSLLIEGGYKPGEQSANFDILTGMFFYYALGTKTTVQGEVDHIPNGKYTHTITSSEGHLPSLELFIKFGFDTNSLMYHLQGVKVKSLEVTAEVGEETPVKATAELIIAKIDITTSDQVSIDALTLRRFNFPDTTCKITYNSAEISSNSLLNKFTVKIENELEFKNQLGDEYPIRSIEGTRKISVSADQMIRSKVLYDLAKTYKRNYATAINAEMTMKRSDDDSIKVEITDLILMPMKHKFPSWDSKELMGELQFENGPTCSITVTVKDLIADY